jgi:RNA-directed DNA polymerase
VKAPDFQNTTATKLKRIAWLSSQDKHKVFNNLMHLFNEDSLTECYRELEGKKALGIDGVSKESYGEQLQANIQNLIKKVKQMSYRPGSILEVLIPKEGRPGETRPLGISNFEDKLFQRMMHKVLESIYEPLFYDCSFGFRPGRGCHDAIRALRTHLCGNEVETIIDIDLANFFGTIDHEILLNILKEKIADERLLRYVVRMLKAGLLRDGELKLSEEGVPQGTICSPILSNIFAHTVIDQWIKEIVQKHCKGKVELFRYCDDAVICCRYASDAERVRKALCSRLEKYKLRLNEDKTKLVKFSRKDFIQKKLKPESFDFLGFTFYWGRSKKGIAIPKVKTCGKRLRSKLVKVNAWAKAVRNKYKLSEIWKQFCVKIGGHVRYYGVTFNTDHVGRFLYHATFIIFKWLNRRSQRKSFRWEKFLLYFKRNPLPKVKVWHALY